MRLAALGLLAISLSGCEAVGVKGPKVCEEWVKKTIENPQSYRWEQSGWSSNGPDVELAFSSEKNGRRVKQSADCNFKDPSGKDPVIDAANSSISSWDF